MIAAGLGRLLRWALASPPTHVREGYISEGLVSRVSTACGQRVHPDRTTPAHRAVTVQLAAHPIQFGRVAPERWVTCPACRTAAGWFVHAPATGSGVG